MSEPYLTILFTANLAGRLDLLPRLFSQIQQARAAASGPVTLIDLGQSCDPEAWECAATEGRAALTVLDAMGYAAARLSEAEGRRMARAAAERLCEHIGMTVCAPDHDILPASAAWEVRMRRVALLAGPGVRPDADLIVCAGESCRLDAGTRTLWLALPPGGVLAWAEVFCDAECLTAAAFRQQAIPDGLRPDATVAAAVEFVRDEARRYREVRSRGNAHAAG